MLEVPVGAGLGAGDRGVAQPQGPNHHNQLESRRRNRLQHYLLLTSIRRSWHYAPLVGGPRLKGVHAFVTSCGNPRGSRHRGGVARTGCVRRRAAAALTDTAQVRIAQADPQFCATRSRHRRRRRPPRLHRAVGRLHQRPHRRPGGKRLGRRGRGSDHRQGPQRRRRVGVGRDSSPRSSGGQELAVQTCRRSGIDTVDVTVRFISADFSSTETGYKLKLVRAPVKTDSERARLDSLGLDTTDHPGPGTRMCCSTRRPTSAS